MAEDISSADVQLGSKSITSALAAHSETTSWTTSLPCVPTAIGPLITILATPETTTSKAPDEKDTNSGSRILPPRRPIANAVDALGYDAPPKAALS